MTIPADSFELVVPSSLDARSESSTVVSGSDARRRRRRAPTRVVVAVSAISHAVTLITTVLALGTSDTDVACSIIAVTATLACLVRVIAGGLRYPDREVDLCWLVFQGSFLFWFCLPGVSRAISGDWYKDAALVVTTPDSFGWAWVAILSFAALFDTVYSVVRPNRNLRAWVGNILGNQVSYRPKVLLIVLAFAVASAIIIYVAMIGGVSGLFGLLLSLRGGAEAENRVWVTDGNFSTKLSTFSLLTDTVLNIAAVVSGEIALNARVKGKARKAAFVLWFISGSFFVLLGAGARSLLALALCAPLSLWLRRRLMSGLGLGRVITLVVCAALVLWFSSFLRASRNTGFGETAEDVSFVYQDDVDFVGATALSYQIFDLSGGPTDEESAAWMVLVNPIPRWLWPSKPQSRVIGTYSYYDWNLDIYETGGNSLPSIVGQALLSGGWFGILFSGLGWGLMAALGDAAIRDTWDGWPPVIWGLFAWWMFTTFRAVGPAFITGAYFLVIAINLRRLFWFLQTRVQPKIEPHLRIRS